MKTRSERTFRSMREICEHFLPERHRNRRCDCPMPSDLFGAYLSGEITVEAYIKGLHRVKTGPWR
jgi:hypothetical protein